MAEIPEPDRLSALNAGEQGKRPVGNPRWYPGMPSPNPSGRPKGIVDRRMRLTQALAEDADTIVDVVKSAAREGNLQAAALVLSRVAAPLKARAETVEFELDPYATPSEMSRSVLVAVSEGRIDPDSAKTLLDMVSAHIGLRDIESFMAELRKLKNERGHQEIPGGIVHVENT